MVGEADLAGAADFTIRFGVRFIHLIHFTVDGAIIAGRTEMDTGMVTGMVAMINTDGAMAATLGTMAIEIR